MSSVDGQKLIALLGLARRAGRLAVGFSAVETMVKKGQAPMVIVASDMGASQRGKVDHWEPLRGILDDGLTAEEMAQAMGREKLSIVGVCDSGFVKGIQKLVAGGNER